MKRLSETTNNGRDDSGHISSIFPGHKSEVLSSSVQPRIVFSKEVNPNSLNLENIFLLDSMGKLVEYTGCIEKNNIYYIHPKEKLLRNKQYSIKFGIGIMLKNGEYLNLTGFSIDFTTT